MDFINMNIGPTFAFFFEFLLQLDVTLIACGIAIFLVCSSLLIFKTQRCLPVTTTTRCLFVIAHPDDETMFFGPTIRRLLHKGCQLHVLCITTGDAEGLGVIRKNELTKAVVKLGMYSENLTILDMKDYPDSMKTKIILQHIEKLDINIVITFDGYGVSGHPNHSSCFHSMQFLYTNGLVPIDVQIFVLDSIPLWRKYTSFFDVFISYFTSTFLTVASPCDIWCTYSAMHAHKSQLLWFRYLYMAFSRYVIVNSLKRISLQSRFYSRKSQ